MSRSLDPFDSPCREAVAMSSLRSVASLALIVGIVAIDCILARAWLRPYYDRGAILLTHVLPRSLRDIVTDSKTGTRLGSLLVDELLFGVPLSVLAMAGGLIAARDRR